jgi:hypothetical protein
LLTLGDQTGVYTVEAISVGVFDLPAIFTATATSGVDIFLPIIFKDAG